MATEVVEKENQRDYSTKSIDKQKLNNKFDENKSKKASKSRKSGRFEEFDGGKLKDLKQVDKLSNMFEDQDGGMLDYYDLTTERGKRNKKKNLKGNEERTKQKIFKLTEITIPETITVKDLAAELKKTSAEVIKKLFGYGIMATINNQIDFDTAFLVASEFGINAIKKEEVKEEDILFDDSEDKEEELEKRPPVVVVMGHVDHGKTSLLDAIRSTNVIEGEAGGITQHIGAYKVNVNDREITFLDTPGHEAFTAMRARGAQITDIAILVVAADDGVMPQTVEAINHAKAAEIPIIVAVNKMDLPGANVEKIKQELMQYELVPEEWGGDTIFVPISAKNKTNIDTLLEMVLLVADVKDLKANPKKQAKGVVIEARLDKAKGPIASMLVQRGTLDVGDTIVVGTSIGRIRAMKNDKGQMVKKAGPSTPVEIMGLVEVPRAGDTFYEVKNEKMAKHLIERRKRQEREKSLNLDNKVTLTNLFEKMENENLKQLNIIVKADVQGTAQAVKQSLEKLSNEEVKVKVIHAIAGGVTESDVQLAKAAKAIIIAFNVRPVGTAKEMADKEEVEIKQYSVIYQAIEDVEAAMKGMLDPIFEEKVIGNAEVRQTFKVSSIGTIAGCYVLDGKIERNAGVRIIRDSVVIHEGKLASLKRFKDDVKEVAKGYECGMQIEGYNDLKEGDIIEVFVMEQVKR
jgi:translation initiation factor IF-2